MAANYTKVWVLYEFHKGLNDESTSNKEIRSNKICSLLLGKGPQVSLFVEQQMHLRWSAMV